MSGIIWDVKFQSHVFFWVRNMKLRRTPPLPPPSCILQVPPWGNAPDKNWNGSEHGPQKIEKRVKQFRPCILDSGIDRANSTNEKDARKQGERLQLRQKGKRAVGTEPIFIRLFRSERGPNTLRTLFVYI